MPKPAPIPVPVPKLPAPKPPVLPPARKSFAAADDSPGGLGHMSGRHVWLSGGVRCSVVVV